MKHELGDAPIEQQYIKTINLVARWIDRMFNGVDRDKERKTGFVLLVFPFGETSGRCNYISNGASRKDIAIMFREQAARFEGMPEQEGHA